MHWPLMVLAAFFTLTATQVAQTQDDTQKQWCEAACLVAPPTAPPPGCNCNATISTGSGGPASAGGGGGEVTPAEFFDNMIATYEAEIAQVQDYTLIEKSKAAPLADIRYYEKRSSTSPANPESDGGFVWIPNNELGRRELAANPNNGRTGNSRVEIPPEVANDPTLFLNGLADAFAQAGGMLGVPELGAVLGQASDQAATDIRAGTQESRDGIEGADTLGGLLSEPLLVAFKGPDASVRFGMWADEGAVEYLKDYFFEYQYHKFEPGTQMETSAASTLSMGKYAGFQVGPLQPGEAALMGWDKAAAENKVWPCVILGLPPNTDGSAAGLPNGSTIESGELWLCRIRGQARPVRLSLTYLEATAGGFARTTVQKENQDFAHVGPVMTPRRIKNRISRGADFFVDELERVIRVNEGLLTQARLAELVGESMDWDTFYQAQGVP